MYCHVREKVSKVFSPRGHSSSSLMESQLSLHEEMEALGSNIHNVPLISAGDMVGWNFALIPFNPYLQNPIKPQLQLS